jgi:multiple sugar transport system permease protein
MTNTASLEEYTRKHLERKGTLRKYLIVTAFLLPFLAAFITFFVIPLVYGIHISLTNFKYGAPGNYAYNSFKWYRDLFDPNFKSAIYQVFWRSFLHSFVFAVIMVPIAILLPLGLAILVNMKPKGYKVFRAIIYLPSIVPLTAAGTVFTMLFLDKSQHGLLNELFSTDIKWFVDSLFKFQIGNFSGDVALAWIPIFLMCLWGGWGGNFIILSAGLQNVPRNLYEASQIDGCSAWRKTRAVTIPGIKGQLVLCLFTTIIGYLGLYGQNFVLSNGGPTIPAYSSLPAGGKTSTIIYFIQDIVANNANFRASLYGLGAAASIVFALITGLISGFQMYCTRDKKPSARYSEAFSKWQRIR